MKTKLIVRSAVENYYLCIRPTIFYPKLCEVWIYWDNEGCYHRRSWTGSGDEPATTSARVLTNRKHLATVFWDAKVILVYDILPQGQSINANRYCYSTTGEEA